MREDGRPPGREELKTLRRPDPGASHSALCIGSAEVPPEVSLARHGKYQARLIFTMPEREALTGSVK